MKTHEEKENELHEDTQKRRNEEYETGTTERTEKITNPHLRPLHLHSIIRHLPFASPPLDHRNSLHKHEHHFPLTF